MTKVCSIEDCEASAQGSGAGRGWCSKHYGRWRAHGDVRGKRLTCEVCQKTDFAPSNATKFCSPECRDVANAQRVSTWIAENHDHVLQSRSEYYQQNRDRIREQVKQYRIDNPEIISERNRRYRELYPELVSEGKKRCYYRKRDEYLAKSKAYRELNREALLERAKTWQRANPDAVRAIKKRYKIRRRGWETSDSIITQRALDRLMIHCQGRCAYCKADLSSGYHWDHVVPLSRGGSHSEGNLTPACPSCNLSKSNKTVMEWRVNGRARNLKMV